MDKDIITKRSLSDNGRYADLLNGFLFGGEQKVHAEDLAEMDTQIGLWKIVKRKNDQPRYRDLIRKVAFGVNFAVIGVENQEEVHYLMPLRSMAYDVAEYERQTAKMRKKVRKRRKIRKAEFLSGFGKSDRLHPCITIVLYFGKDWDGSRELHELLDFTDIPKELKKYVGNYQIHIFEVRKWTDTDLFRTDLKQIFDFIRYSEDREKLQKLVASDPEYQSMEEDAYDMASAYAEEEDMLSKRKYKGKDGKVNMCKGLRDWLDETREEGRVAGHTSGMEEKELVVITNMLKKGFSDEDICELTECKQETLDAVRAKL